MRILGLLVLLTVVFVLLRLIKGGNGTASRRCPHCGNQVPAVGTYCPICGKRVV